MDEIEKFKLWMTDRGRGANTARLYAFHVRKCLEHPRGHTGRIMDGKFAPKTRRSILASMRAWAKFKKDKDLKEALEDIKLPPPMRKTVKTPITKDELLKFARVVEKSDYPEPVKAVINCMVFRGLRVGDVLRLTSGEVRDALKSGTLSFEAKGGRRLEYRIKSFRGPLEALFEALKKTGAERVRGVISPRSHPDRQQEQAVENIEVAVRALAKVAKIDKLHPHRFRRTYATEFLKLMKGDPEGIVKLMAHMQWNDVQTVMGYVDATRKEELDAVEDRMFETVDDKKKRR